jgi:hypothetical protein
VADPTNLFRVTFHIVLGEAEWSESYYLLKNTMGDAANVVFGPSLESVANPVLTSSLAVRRSRLLPGQIGNDAANPKITTVKITDMQNKNRTRKQTVDLQGSLFMTTVGNPPDMPWTGQLVRMISTNNHRRILDIRPVLDSETVQPWDNKLPEASDWGKELRNWMAGLRANGGALRVLTDQKLTMTAITSMTVDPLTGLVVVSTAPNKHNLKPGQAIRMYRNKCVPSIKGRFTVSLIDDFSFTLDKTNLGLLVVTGPCAFYQEAFTGDNLKDWLPLRAMARPIFGGQEGPRGRKSRRTGPRRTN